MRRLFLKINENWNSLTIATRVFVFGFTFCLVITILAGQVIRTRVIEARENSIFLLTRFIQSQIDQKDAGPSILNRLDSVAIRNGIEMWLIDEEGNVLSSTHQSPLIFPWNEFAIPVNEYEVAWFPTYFWGDHLAVVRLVSQPTRYAVFLFAQKGSFERFGLLVLLGMIFLMSLGIALYAQRIVLPEDRRAVKNA